ncbi:MAG: hypothetical protein HP490_09660 [Nitrospira sp.]|nr:hypothetical protein [Nitrospira sp.]MBH0185715.1 hypothetical protein [Nitrospira sp.]
MRLFFIIGTIAVVTLVGCTTPSMESPQRSMSNQPPQRSITTHRPYCPSGLTNPSRSTIVQTAATLVGATTITSKGRKIAYDCAGVTRAVFLKHGIDLYETDADDPNANGVRLIYDHVRRQGILHLGPATQPGDLVFFDNTWDFNGDGEWNDPLTHVGIVEQIEPDGTVVFISRVADAIQRYRMNLRHPQIHKTADGRILNDYIRRKLPTDPGHLGRLTGELFASYGTRLPS